MLHTQGCQEEEDPLEKGHRVSQKCRREISDHHDACFLPDQRDGIVGLIGRLERCLERLESERGRLDQIPGVPIPCDAISLLSCEVKSVLKEICTASQGSFSLFFCRQAIDIFARVRAENKKSVQVLCAQVQSQSETIEQLTRDYLESLRTAEETNHRLESGKPTPSLSKDDEDYDNVDSDLTMYNADGTPNVVTVQLSTDQELRETILKKENNLVPQPGTLIEPNVDFQEDNCSGKMNV